MLNAIVWLTLFTFIPALELRFSVPVGIFGIPARVFGADMARLGAPVSTLGPDGIMPWWLVVAVCVIANIVLGWIVFFLMGPFFNFVRKWKWFDNRVWPILEKTRHKVHPYVEKYGAIGIAVFIGIPLPGSGVYTGAFGAYLLGMKKREFSFANVIGVLIAAAAVSTLCLLILHGAVGDDSWIAKLFLKMKH